MSVLGIKSSNGDTPVLELCVMSSTPSLPLLSGLLCLSVLELFSVLSIGKNGLIIHYT